MSQERVIAAVKGLASLLAGIGYAFMGPTNLYLQGMDVEPGVIEILATPEGIRAIDEALAAYRTGEASVYGYGGFGVEVASTADEGHNSPEALARKIFVGSGDTRLPVLTLLEEANACRGAGEEVDARLIEEYIASY